MDFRKWIITITVIVASLLELIDTTIVNVALPNIMGNLGATLDDADWIVTGYAVANVIILPMSGWLGDRFGRKNYFITSIMILRSSRSFAGMPYAWITDRFPAFAGAGRRWIDVHRAGDPDGDLAA